MNIFYVCILKTLESEQDDVSSSAAAHSAQSLCTDSSQNTSVAKSTFSLSNASKSTISSLLDNSATLKSSNNTEDEAKVKKILKTSAEQQKESNNDTSTLKLCAICYSEEKCLVCIPCGHFATCVPCGHSLRLCPMCRRTIDAFVRIYI